MIPSPIPPQLQGLTQIEEMLIACALPIMRVYIKPGGQRGYQGGQGDCPRGTGNQPNHSIATEQDHRQEAPPCYLDPTVNPFSPQNQMNSQSQTQI